MPEGPEVARQADRIRQAIEGRIVRSIRFAFPHLHSRAESLVGRRVTSVKPRGKALLLELEDAATIYTHNQLYGRWYVLKAGSRPRTNRQLRLAIETDDRAALLYSASEIEILDEAGLAEHRYLRKLGPDALDPGLEVSSLVRRFRDRRFAGRTLAALLLDQGFVAGLGNYLRSEICFEARLHPSRKPKDLSVTECRRLARAILRLPRRAYDQPGVTLPPARVRSLKKAGATRRQLRHWVFARAGLPCRICDTPIERLDLAGRRVYLCPRCEPEA